MAARLATADTWLAVPIKTLNDVAMSGRRTAMKTNVEKITKLLRSNVGRRKRFLRLSALESEVMFFYLKAKEYKTCACHLLY
jgi:hypothetical protein